MPRHHYINRPTPEQHYESPHVPVSWESIVATLYTLGLRRLTSVVEQDARIYVEWSMEGPTGEDFGGDFYAWCWSEAAARILLGLRDEIEATLDDLEAEHPDAVPVALSTIATLDEFVNGPSTGEAPGHGARPLDGPTS